MSTEPLDTQRKAGHLGVALATWIYTMHNAGREPADDAILAACKDLDRAGAHSPAVGQTGGGPDINALGLMLVIAVEAHLGDATDFAAVLDLLGQLFDSEHLATTFAGTREERAQAARSYQFMSSLPWLACLIDRFPDGEVGPHWVMVERLTDRVYCMDPYPWDDVDEEYTTPIVDFMVKWELAGGQSIRWVG